MKNLYALVFILGFPFLLTAQTIHGIWTGTLTNDSSKRIQNFEMGLSEYRGKITGYTYTTFIDNDTFYYSIKRIKAERKDGKLVVEDGEMVGNNFPERASKHVKQTTTFPLINDTTIDIANGRWSTNKTKNFYSIGGSATVRVQDDEKKSDLLAHLDEANIKTDLAVQKKKDEGKKVVKDDVAVSTKKNKDQKSLENKNPDATKKLDEQPGKTKSTAQIDAQKNGEQKVPENKVADIAKNSNDQSLKPNTVKSNTVPDVKTGTLNNENNSVKENTPVAKINRNNDIVNSPSTKQTLAENKPVTNSGKTISIINQPAPVQSKPLPLETNAPKQIDNNTSITKPVTQAEEIVHESKALPTVVADRKNENIQDIYFKTDSLVLALYDNGIVDGDTVSVFMNGESVIAKQMLKASALKKTIYISQNTDSVQLVLFADNLGSIPPNTGLLTVKDGDDVYQVRFSADLQKNASIILRRKK